MPYLPDGTPYILEGSGYPGSVSSPVSSSFVSVGTGGYIGGNPAYAADIAAIDAQQNYAYQQYLASQLGLPVNDARMGSIALQRELAQKQYEAEMMGLGVVDAQGRVNDANWQEAQAQYDAAGKQIPVVGIARDTALAQADQSVASAEANAATALAANEAQRMGLANSERMKNRDLQSVAPSIAASYRGSSYVDPNAIAQRDDIGAELGILSQQKRVVDNQDRQVNLSRSQAGEMAGLSRRAANAQYDSQMANIGLRDQRLGVQQAVRDAQIASLNQQRARIGLAGPQLAATNAGYDIQAAQIAQDRANIGLNKWQYDAQVAQYNAQRQRALFNGTSVGQGRQGGTYGSGVGQGYSPASRMMGPQDYLPVSQSRLGGGEYGSAFGENGFFNGGDGGLPWNSAYRQGGAFANSGWF